MAHSAVFDLNFGICDLVIVYYLRRVIGDYLSSYRQIV